MKSILLLIQCVVIALSLSGQCPDKDTLWKRILYLRDSSKVSPKTQLEELLPYLNVLKQCPYKNDSTHALLLQRIGWLYAMQKDFVKCIQYNRQSISLTYEHLSAPSTNQELLIQSYTNLWLSYDSLGQTEKKKEARDSCISVALRIKKRYDFAVALLYHKVMDMHKAGDYFSCINDAELGENIARTNQKDIYYANYYITNFIIWKINSLVFLKKFEIAEKLIESKIEEHKREGTASGNLGPLYSLSASIVKEKGGFDKAEHYYNLFFSDSWEAKNYSGCAEALNNIGFNYFDIKHQYDKAMKFYYKALKYADSTEALNIYDNIANVYSEKKQYDSALFFFKKAFSNIKKDISEPDLLKMPIEDLKGNIKFITGLVLDKADSYLKQYKESGNVNILKIAVQSYKTADLVFDKVRFVLNEEESKLFWRTSNIRLYEHAIEASFLENNSAGAFYFFEKSRSVILNDQLKEKHQLATEDILKLAQIKRRILQLQKDNSSNDPSSKQYSEVKENIFTSQQELSRLEKIIRERNPLYYQSFLDTSFMSLRDSKEKLLKDHQAILELFNGDSAVYCFMVTEKNIFLSRINKSDFDSTVSLYTYYLSHPEKMNAHYNDYVQTSLHLYQLIFQNNPVPNGRIIISPDGQYFPFEALVTSKTGEAVNYFLNDHAVSYTYSARFLLNEFYSNSLSSGKNFMGIAPVSYPSMYSLASLNGSDRSLANISGHFANAENMILSDATKNNFLQQFYKYKIIQLYTHASESSKNNEPVIYFADSALYLSDLIGENKPLTRLVVLSACETGLGKDYKGEGVFSFNRGFAALGIPSSVTNLWTVDNESTYKITELFYKYVADGLSLDVALQKAKLDFIKTSSSGEKKLPCYWAAAVLVGNAESISINRNTNWAYYTTAIGIPVLFFAIFMALRKRRRFTPIPGKVETAS